MATQDTVGEVVTPSPQEPPVPNPNPSATGYYPAPARGLTQLWGLHPGISFLTFIVDTMLGAEEVLTMGLGIIFSIACAGVMGFITYRAQKAWYGDSHDSALVKSFILGFLVAIPTPLPSVLYVAAGVAGLFRKKN